MHKIQEVDERPAIPQTYGMKTLAERVRWVRDNVDGVESYRAWSERTKLKGIDPTGKGVSEPTITRIARGQGTNPGRKTLQMMAKAAGVSYSWLDRNEGHAQPDQLEDFADDPFEGRRLACQWLQRAHAPRAVIDGLRAIDKYSVDPGELRWGEIAIQHWREHIEDQKLVRAQRENSA